MTESEIAALLARYQRPQSLPTTRDTPFAPPGPEPELRSYQPPWYDRMSDMVTALLHGPDANAQQRERVNHLIGPDNPFNLPAQFSEGYNTAKQGYDLGNAGMFGLGALGMAMALPVGAPKGARPRALDPLGYYSQALEAAHALPQAKGTPEQMLAQLKKAGVKDNEIKATGLDAYLTGRPSVTRDEIVNHLDSNRVGLKEVQYGRDSGDYPPELAARDAGYRSVEEAADVLGITPEQFVERHDASPINDSTRWSKYSLDPSNSTYRETVLHLPSNADKYEAQYKALHREQLSLGAKSDAQGGRLSGSDADRSRQIDRELKDMRDAMKRDAAKNFKSGHFPEPNIVGHMMTSMTRHEGKPVYTIDQIQSDWGQKLRDGGVRDEAKIAELRKQGEVASTKRQMQEEAIRNFVNKHGGAQYTRLDHSLSSLEVDNPNSEIRTLGKEMMKKWEAARAEEQRLEAELRTALASSLGHPLVNTTDQWTNTTLRRALTQAVESGADHIAIPSGKTVLGYNPGNERGMSEFYDKIVPKNLANLLAKMDPAAARRLSVPTLDSPSGMTGLGSGFSVFPLTEAVKKHIREKGQPLFAAPLGYGLLAPTQDENR